MVTDLFLHQRRRRLPVFFLLDTSKNMDGTYQVIMQDGLLVVKSTLAQHGGASEHVYLSGITLGEETTSQLLAPLEAFHLPAWQAQGVCKLKPALASLAEAFRYDLIVAKPGNPGDYPPLIFLILGGDPADAWPEIPAELASLEDNRRPLMITLVTRQDLLDKARAISHYVFLLEPASAAHLTNYFFWVARTIAKFCDDCENGTTTTIIDFPALPYGVVGPC